MSIPSLENLIEQFRIIDESILNHDWKTSTPKYINEMRFKLNKLLRESLKLKLSFEDDKLFKAEHHESTRSELQSLIDNINVVNDILKNAQTEVDGTSLRVLTLISTICLPLNLVTGFFSMNTPFMKSLNDSSAGNTTFVASLIIAIVLILVLISKGIL